MNKLISVFLVLISTFAFLIPTQGAAKEAGTNRSYGVFIGVNPSNLSKLYDYSAVVIDAAYFSADEIKQLHNKKVKVYSYINLGSIENFRSYYSEFEKIALGNYENWPDEKWIDVSKKEWQDYFVDVLAKELVDKGVDGFFIDNIDVYAKYKTSAIYKGILSVLQNLNTKYRLPIILNGGYEFIMAAQKNKIELKTLFYGVNQESVFSHVNFETNTFIRNNVNDRKFVLQYLNSLKALGIKIYLTEYTQSVPLINEIRTYCKKNNFTYYISSSLNLD